MALIRSSSASATQSATRLLFCTSVQPPIQCNALILVVLWPDSGPRLVENRWAVRRVSLALSNMSGRDASRVSTAFASARARSTTWATWASALFVTRTAIRRWRMAKAFVGAFNSERVSLSSSSSARPHDLLFLYR